MFPIQRKSISVKQNYRVCTFKDDDDYVSSIIGKDCNLINVRIVLTGNVQIYMVQEVTVVVLVETDSLDGIDIFSVGGDGLVFRFSGIESSENIQINPKNGIYETTTNTVDVNKIFDTNNVYDQKKVPNDEVVLVSKDAKNNIVDPTLLEDKLDPNIQKKVDYLVDSKV